MDNIEQIKQEVLNLLPPVQAIRDTLMGNLQKNPGIEKIEYWIDIRDSMLKQQGAATTVAANPQTAKEMPSNAAAEGDFEISMSGDGNSVIITRYTGSDTVLEIPSQINGKPVTGIGNGAFGYNSLTGVTIGRGITELTWDTFTDNVFREITLPPNVTKIDRAFDSWVKLIGFGGNKKAQK